MHSNGSPYLKDERVPNRLLEGQATGLIVVSVLACGPQPPPVLCIGWYEPIGLRRARRLPNESFSKVIKRAEWPLQPRTAGALLSAMAKIAPIGKEVIDRLDTAQGLDRPPEDPWRDD